MALPILTTSDTFGKPITYPASHGSEHAGH